jgi:hypothetical protein
MDFDALLRHYFGTADLETLSEDALGEGAERMRLGFATEADPGRRFALWAVLHGLGEAPDPATAFKDRREREAAYDYARAIDLTERG